MDPSFNEVEAEKQYANHETGFQSIECCASRIDETNPTYNG